MARKSSRSSKPPPSEPEPEVAEEAEGEAAPAAAGTDNVGDISVELNVEDLIAQIEVESKGGANADGVARRKIEEILEDKRVSREIMDMEDYDLDD